MTSLPSQSSAVARSGRIDTARGSRRARMHDLCFDSRGDRVSGRCRADRNPATRRVPQELPVAAGTSSQARVGVPTHAPRQAFRVGRRTSPARTGVRTRPLGLMATALRWRTSRSGGSASGTAWTRETLAELHAGRMVRVRHRTTVGEIRPALLRKRAEIGRVSVSPSSELPALRITLLVGASQVDDDADHTR